MYASAEIRFWWQGDAPREVSAWFDAGAFAPGGGALRTDRYLVDASTDEVGIKRCGNGGTEIKLLYGEGPTAGDAPFDHPIEFWTKSNSALDLDGTGVVAVDKVRRLRKFALADDLREIELDGNEMPRAGGPPAAGCNVELTAVTRAASRRWTTLGLEAFGDIDGNASTLRRTLRALGPLGLAAAPWLVGSYPRWLRETLD